MRRRLGLWWCHVRGYDVIPLDFFGSMGALWHAQWVRDLRHDFAARAPNAAEVVRSRRALCYLLVSLG